MPTPIFRATRVARLFLVVALVLAVFSAGPAAAQAGALRGKIVYVSLKGAVSTSVSTLQDSERLELYVMNTDGTGQRRVETGLIAHFNPQWSADGASVLLAGWPGGIFTVDVGTDRALAVGRLGFAAAWSPDQQQIAYANMDTDMQIMNADGTGSHAISSKFSLRGDHPAWSPDGQQLMFSYELTPADSKFRMFVLVRIDADGSNLSLLDRRRGFVPFNSIQAGTPILPAVDGEWSPDGEKIVFMAEDDIFVANSDGTGFTNLTSHEAVDRDPSWSPDGSHVLFSSDRAGSFDLYVMNAFGDDVRRLTSSDGDEFWGDWWAPPLGSEPEPTPGPPGAAAGRCTGSSARTINLRNGPGTDFDVARQLDAGETVEIDGQKTGSDGLVWFRLTTGEWAREDVIDESPECTGVPRIQ